MSGPSAPLVSTPPVSAPPVSAPPAYNEASTSHYPGDRIFVHRSQTPERGQEVTIQPSGYERIPSPFPTTSISPGGLRLDKARFDKSEKDRDFYNLFIDFEKVACCPWELEGLPEGCREYIPEELRVKGISPNEWAEWCDELMIIQKKAPSIGGCYCIFKWLPCCYGDWYCGLREWQNKVNSVLNPLDMHCKLKTYKPYQNAPISLLYNERVRGKDEDYEMSMLEIALTAAEAEKLMTESWDCGVNYDGCTSSRGRIL